MTDPFKIPRRPNRTFAVCAPIHRQPSASAGLLWSCSARALTIILDGSIVNVALPSIQSDLGFSQSSLAWVVYAYLIAFGGLLLLAGRLGDLIGRKRILMTGLTVSVLASLACGLSQSQEMLIGPDSSRASAGPWSACCGTDRPYTTHRALGQRCSATASAGIDPARTLELPRSPLSTATSWLGS